MVRLLAALVLLADLLLVAAAGAAPQGAAFTYQGRLESAGVPASGDFQLRFTLHDQLAAGSQVGSTLTLSSVPVSAGLFSVDLDFGAGVWTGQARWLEVSVKSASDPDFVTLAPRQPVTSVPYATYALNGAGGGGGTQWSNGAAGIEYAAGNVGIGGAAHPSARLRIDQGATTGNPAWISNANASYAALYLQNTATNGYGLYDDQSDQHYLSGNLGAGTFPLNNVRMTASGGAGMNGGYFTNNSPGNGFAALVMRNFGAGGWGLYDDTSGQHYLKGRLGINVSSSLLSFNVGGSGRFSYTGNSSDGEGYSSALWAHGYTGTGPGGRVSNGLTAGSTDGRGVYGISQNMWGVVGENLSAGTYGILGTPNEGLYAQTQSTVLPAARFSVPAGGVALEANGLAKVKTLQILGGADLAERFHCPGGAEPGTVMAIDPSVPGQVRISTEAYCSTVAGVASGANELDAGIELGVGEPHADEVALALTGRVWVKCDASRSPIHPGDLLTTASRPGHAMCAADRERAAGAVLGKAMTSLDRGVGLVLVLVSLQ